MVPNVILLKSKTKKLILKKLYLYNKYFELLFNNNRKHSK